MLGFGLGAVMGRDSLIICGHPASPAKFTPREDNPCLQHSSNARFERGACAARFWGFECLFKGLRGFHCNMRFQNL